jgi:hypothetical protein
VKRGLVSSPEDWPWSSFLQYATGETRIVKLGHVHTKRSASTIRAK